MADLFDRYISVTVGTRQITGLRMAFKVIQSNKPEPNTVELAIWNLSESSRAALQRPQVPTLIDAGYAGNHAILFKGDLRRGTSARQGADWVTTLKAGDGEVAYRTARVNESVAPGTLIKDVAKRVAEALGVSAGDAARRIDAAVHRTGLTQYTNGAALSGFARDHLTTLCKSLGLEWSIQDGALQILPEGEATNDPAILLTARTGLVGSPAPGEKGVLKVVSLLQPAIRPGRKINVDAGGGLSFYRVTKVTHQGDTHGQPWYSEAEAVPL